MYNWKRDIQIPLVPLNNEFYNNEEVGRYKYDPFQSPPNIQMAKIHAVSRKVGIDETKTNFCPCCSNPINKKSLSIFCSEHELSFLGSGYPLFFALAKYFSLILIGLFLFGGSFHMIINNMSCMDSNCVLFYGLAILDLRTVDQLAVQRQYTNIFTAVCLFILIIYVKKKIYVDIDKYNNLCNTPARYTIVVKNLHIDTTQQDLIDFFTNELKQKVIKINMSYNLNSYLSDFENKAKFIKQLNLSLLSKKYDRLEEPYLTECNKQIIQFQQNIEILSQRMEKYEHECDPLKCSSKFSGTAFISFELQSTVNEILKKHGATNLRTLRYIFCKCFKPPYLKYKNNVIIIKRAPSPSDVIWENLQFSFRKFIINNTIMVFISFGLLLFSFYIQLLVIQLTYPLQLEGEIEQNDPRVKIIAILASFGVIATNFLLLKIIYFFTQLLRFHSRTVFISKFVNYYIMLHFLNSAFLPYLVHAQFNHSHYMKELLTWDIHFILLSNAFFNPLYRFLDFSILKRWYMRYKIQHYKSEECPYTQYEANYWFEGKSFDISESYSYISKTLFLTAWYASAAPLGIVFSLCGLFIQYWIDKIFLLRICSSPDSLTQNVIKKVINSLEWIPFIYVSGAIQYEAQLSLSFNIFEWLSQFFTYGLCAVTLLLVLLGYIIFFKQKIVTSNLSNKSYDQERMNFIEEYDKQNPITQQQANYEWTNYIQSNQELDDKDKEQLQQFQIYNKFNTLQTNIIRRNMPYTKSNILQQQLLQNQKVKSLKSISEYDQNQRFFPNDNEINQNQYYFKHPSIQIINQSDF